MIEIETKHTHPFLAMKLINDLQIALSPVGWGGVGYSLLFTAFTRDKYESTMYFN